MTVIATAIKHMLAAGMDHDAIVAAVADMEANTPKDAQAERRRQADKERKRLRNSAESADLVEQVSPKKETSPAPLKEKTTPSQSEPNGSSKTPRQALECVLDAEHAGSVIDHRQRIRKPLTLKAAQLLAGEFAKCPDPNAGADAMVLNGWQGFDPKWMDRQQARGSPGQRSERADPFKEYARELDGQVRNTGRNGSDWDDAQSLPVLAIDYHRG